MYFLTMPFMLVEITEQGFKKDAILINNKLYNEIANSAPLGSMLRHIFCEYLLFKR